MPLVTDFDIDDSYGHFMPMHYIPEYLAKHSLAFRGQCSIRWYRILCCHLELV